MSFEAQCPQCLFVSRQLGQPTPCLLHVSLAAERGEPSEPAPAVGDYDEPYVFGQVHPSVDKPGPFTLREYVRLSLLRSRIQDERQDERAVPTTPELTQAESLARR